PDMSSHSSEKYTAANRECSELGAFLCIFAGLKVQASDVLVTVNIPPSFFRLSTCASLITWTDDAELAPQPVARRAITVRAASPLRQRCVINLGLLCVIGFLRKKNNRCKRGSSSTRWIWPLVSKCD